MLFGSRKQVFQDGGEKSRPKPRVIPRAGSFHTSPIKDSAKRLRGYLKGARPRFAIDLTFYGQWTRPFCFLVQVSYHLRQAQDCNRLAAVKDDPMIRTPYALTRRAFLNGVAHIAASALGIAIALQTPAQAQTTFSPSETQYIAALGDTAATSGTDAATWGLWAIDPGPRGVQIDDYRSLVKNGGNAPAGWKYDSTAWWLEEHGLIMEAPVFPLPAGKYVVTGGRGVTSVLTVEPADAAGKSAWSLDDGASLYDVTHLGCRAALYTAQQGQACTPDATPQNVFPMRPDISMPAVTGCDKRDYQVLIVVGMMTGA